MKVGCASSPSSSSETSSLSKERGEFGGKETRAIGDNKSVDITDCEPNEVLEVNKYQTNTACFDTISS